MLEPYSGRVYDLAMGSGGFFVSSSKFIEQRAQQEQKYDAAEQKKHISVYGQESNSAIWKLSAMNMTILGTDFNFGKNNTDTFLDDQHPSLRAVFVMANSPLNIKDRGSEPLAEDLRWQYGASPKSSTNLVWIQCCEMSCRFV